MHTMLDLETIGTRPGSVIASIGAVRFDPVLGTIMPDAFYVTIDIADAVKSGLTMDPNTVRWWLTQGDAARRETFSGTTPLALALEAFRMWLGADAKVWCHGATFDAPLLAEAYIRLGMDVPWAYNAARDTRTIFDLAGMTYRSDLSSEIEHHAVHDAIGQAKAVHEAYKRLGLAAFAGAGPLAA